MANGPNLPPSYRLNDLGEYKDLGRGPVTSYFRRVVAPFVPSDAETLRRLTAFSSNIRNWGKWASHVMRYITSPKHNFLNYGTESGVYAFDDKCKLAVAGDWGTGTDEAQHVTSAIKGKHNPDYTVHLGDVYYVGDQPELEENCLGKDGPPINGVIAKGVKWELGTKGSFALNGNHEMYACGDAYFGKFLPKLGTLDPAGNPQGQKASFFCLKNKYWRIVGLDTGYYSTGIRAVLSFLSRIKKVQWLRKTSWFKPSCKLHDDLMKWLSDVLSPAPADADPETIVPATILLSHHEYYSSFDDWYPIPGQQLRRVISPDRPVLWFWGHEHRFAIYDRFRIGDGIEAYGRCVGHGGMPVTRGAVPDITDCNCILYDDRRYKSDEDIDVGYNGFVTLAFNGPTLEVHYYDLYNTLLLTERWISDGKGNLEGPQFQDVNSALTQNDSGYIKSHS
jgi:Calcineurin-like phosphoesterase